MPSEVSDVHGGHPGKGGSHHDRVTRGCVSPKLLHAALRNFTWSLRDTLGHPGVTSLVQALDALGATPGATWANVRAMGSAWWESVAALEDSWALLAWEATELCDICKDAPTTVAIAATQARDPQDKATRKGTAGDSLVATAQQLMVALKKEDVAWVMTVHEGQVVAATNEAMDKAMVATSWARPATRRGHWAEGALGPLERLVAAGDEATVFISYTESRLEEMESIPEETNDTSPNGPEALVAEVAKCEWLWDASAPLAKDHLLGALGNIHELLLSPYGDPGGPGSRAVAEQCNKAMEDIPRLLLGL